MRPIIDMAGQRFGKLTVLHYSHSERGKRKYLCKCDCGKAKIVAGADMRKGHTRSCGCLCARKLETHEEYRERYQQQYKRVKERKKEQKNE